MTGPEEIKTIVQCVAQGLSNHPDKIQVELTDMGDASLCVVIRCHNNGPKDTDLGLVIGKQGKNIRALRAIIESVGAKHKLRTTLVVKE